MLSYLKSQTLLLSILLVGCASPMEFQSKHDHDTVVKFASRRTDNKRQGTEWTKVLESSFVQANEMDLRKIEELKAQNTAQAWERIHAINQRIEKRQARVEPLMPLVSKDGYRPDLRLLPVEEMLAESRAAVIERYLVEIEENIGLARNGQRLKARTAFDRIYFLRKKFQWKDPLSKTLEDEALALGRVYVLLDMNGGYGFYSHTVENDFDFWGLSSLWRVVHRRPQPGIRYDFQAEVDVVYADVSPNRIDRSSRTVTEEIVVKREPVRDTSGNIIRYEVTKETICATIEQIEARKEASLRAECRVYDLATGQRVLFDFVWANDSFSESFCTYSGDTRISATNGCRSSDYVSFPSDWQMLGNCTDDLRFSVGCLLGRVDLEN
jgi:hypothetical protein